MQGLVEVGDRFGRAVDRQTILDEIVRANREELRFRRQGIGEERRRWHLDHDTHGNVALEVLHGRGVDALRNLRRFFIHR